MLYFSETTPKAKNSVRQQYRTPLTTHEESFPIPNEAKLSKPAISKSGNPDILKNLDESSNEMPTSIPIGNIDESNEVRGEESSESTSKVDETEVNLECGDQTGASEDVASVIEKQKQIEEDNKRKKAAIKKVLEDR